MLSDNELKKENARRKIKKNRQAIFSRFSGTKMKKTSKYVDVLATSYLVSTTTIVTLLNGSGSGYDFYQRINRLVYAKELKLRLNFTPTGTAIGYYGFDLSRIIILWDNEAEVTPVAADVLLDVSSGGSVNTHNLSNKNISNKDRFIFLYDNGFNLPAYNITTVNQPNTVSSGHTPNNNEWYQIINIKLDPLITRFNGTGSTISSIASGALYFFMLGGRTSATSGWSVTMASRLSYNDS